MLKSECSVCGARRKFKSLVYDKTLNAYCASANVCSKNHPNSLMNKQMRGGFLDLMEYEEAIQLQKQRTEHVYEEAAHSLGKRIRNVNMHRLVTGSLSFRVQSDIQADYVSYVIAKIGTNKISDALVHILNQAIQRDTAFLAQFQGKREAYHNTPETLVEINEAELKPRDRPTTLPARKPEADEGVFTL